LAHLDRPDRNLFAGIRFTAGHAHVVGIVLAIAVVLAILWLV
jgi:hypothetical protein